MTYTDEQILYQTQELASEFPGICLVWLDNPNDVLRFEPQGEQPGGSFSVYMHRVRTVADELSPQGFLDWLRKQFRAASTGPIGEMNWQVARRLLRCRIQHADQLLAYEATAISGKKPQQIVARALPGLDPNECPWREIPVVDLPDHIIYVPLRLIDRWGVTADEVYAEAHANLKRLDTEFEPIDPDGRILACLDTNYATARLPLLHDLIDPWPEHGVVASAPGRESILVLPIRDAESLEAMKGLFYATWFMWTDFCRGNRHPVSPAVAYFDGQEWEAIAGPSMRPLLLTPGVRLRAALSKATGQRLPEDFAFAVVPPTAVGD